MPRIIDLDNQQILGEDDRWEPLTAGAYDALTRRHVWPTGESVPVICGGSGGPDPLPVFHPLAPPTISGELVTIDVLLQQPTRVTQYLMDITQERFILDRIFTNPGGVTGGAVIYDQIVANDLYTDNDVQQVAPGSEFPVVTSGRRAPNVAPVQKYGGKFWFTKEARDRNDAVAFQRQSTRLGNTIVRKLNTAAVAALEASVTAMAGATNFTGNNWETAVPSGATPTAPALTPGADFSKAQLLAEQEELGVVFNVALVNPVQLNSLRQFYANTYGGSAGMQQMLDDNGYDEVYASNRVTSGVAYFVARGQVGQIRLEQPLQTESWYDAETERFWVQSSVRPVMFVDHPFAVVKATGL